MTTELWALLGFAVWGVVLVTVIGLWRVVLVFTGKKAANAFPSGTQHGDPMYWRLNRAHMNTLENLPLVTAVIAVAALANIHSPLIETAAIVLVAARVAQSLIHISSGSVMAVNLRFTAFAVQLICLALMVWEIVKSASQA